MSETVHGAAHGPTLSDARIESEENTDVKLYNTSSLRLSTAADRAVIVNGSPISFHSAI